MPRPKDPARQNPGTGRLGGKRHLADELAWGKGLASPWLRLTPKRPGTAEKSFLKAHYEPGGVCSSSTSAAQALERNAPRPIAPSKNAQSSPRPASIQQAAGAHGAPGVPTGHHGGGSHRRMRSLETEQGYRQQTQGDCTSAPPEEPSLGFRGGLGMGRVTSSVHCGITATNPSLFQPKAPDPDHGPWEGKH